MGGIESLVNMSTTCCFGDAKWDQIPPHVYWWQIGHDYRDSRHKPWATPLPSPKHSPDFLEISAVLENGPTQPKISHGEVGKEGEWRNIKFSWEDPATTAKSNRGPLRFLKSFFYKQHSSLKRNSSMFVICQGKNSAVWKTRLMPLKNHNALWACVFVGGFDTARQEGTARLLGGLSEPHSRDTPPREFQVWIPCHFSWKVLWFFWLVWLFFILKTHPLLTLWTWDFRTGSCIFKHVFQLGVFQHMFEIRRWQAWEPSIGLLCNDHIVD